MKRPIDLREKKRDLFSPPKNEESKKAPCGFLPFCGTWPHKWARAAHLDNCDDCLRAEADGTSLERNEKVRG